MGLLPVSCPLKEEKPGSWGLQKIFQEFLYKQTCPGSGWLRRRRAKHLSGP